MKVKKIFLYVIVGSLILSNLNFAYGEHNPSREELEAMIEEVAFEKGIPSVILKAIARTESVFKHYNEDGSVLIGSSGSIGLMQIHNSRGTYDNNRLKNDIYYNIEAGANILLDKWHMSASNKVPTIGYMDPNILESWYFPLWAYNSYVESNNPNVLPYYFSTWTKYYAYQDLVLYKVLPEEYNQQISDIDISYLPLNGLPEKTLNIPYPEEVHKGDIILFEEGDKVRIKTGSTLNLRKEPNGEVIGKVSNGEEYFISGEPLLSGGYYWHKIANESGKSLGWAARNWMVLIEKKYKDEDSTDNINKSEEISEISFQDIENHWAKEYIEILYNKGIVKGKSEVEFKPKDQVTKEEFYVMIGRIIELENQEKEVNIKDLDEISDWAFESTYMLYKNDIITLEDGNIMPKAFITRKEVVKSLGKIVRYDGEYKDILFQDIGELNTEELQGLLKIHSLGLISGKDKITFAPEDLITRGELSKLLSMLYEEELTYEIKE